LDSLDSVEGGDEACDGACEVVGGFEGVLCAEVLEGGVVGDREVSVCAGEGVADGLHDLFEVGALHGFAFRSS
jgi:hypothetical protein